METKTRAYNPHVRVRAPEIPPTAIKIAGCTEDEITAEISRIKQLPASPGMNPRLVITVVVDLSGSMGHHVPMIKEMLKEMIKQLSLVNFRDYTLDLILIHNSSAKTVYFGDIRKLKIEESLSLLPEPSGMTPYVDALTLGYNHMNELYRAIEEAEQWYNPNGVFLCITDCLNNQGDGSAITKALTNDFLEGRRTVAEFVTQQNEKGLCPGGYKIFIDQANSRHQVASFMQALRVGSSSVSAIDANTYIPNRRDREARNRFLGDRLAAEMAVCYDRCIKP